MSSIAAVSGFGAYSIPNGQTFDEMQLWAKVTKLFFATLHTLLAVLSASILPIAACIFSYFAARSILELIALFYRAPPVLPSAIENDTLPLGVLSDLPCKGFATRDGINSHAWKLQLIQMAEHSIFISGCYCGGRAFDEALHQIQERMGFFPELKTSILSSEIFITQKNRDRIEALRREFGPRFECILTPEVFPFLSPTTDTLTLTTQHTKALIIDGGAAFMVGGSGMVTSWSEQRGTEPAAQLESHGFAFDHLLTMNAYRDMDFVFQSPINGVGRRLNVEMSKLFQRFGGAPLRLEFEPVALHHLTLTAPIEHLNLACYASGPEAPNEQFLEEMIAQVERAKECIEIGHLYFHPPPRLLQALIDASNRGVKISLITNRWGDKSPGSHGIHAELTRYNALSLFEGREKEYVEVFEYDVPFTSYHKKVMIFDRKTTLLGSANIGMKSLASHDYEINIKVNSREFAQAVHESLEEDKAYCVRVDSPSISLKTRVFSSFQSLCTPFL